MSEKNGGMNITKNNLKSKRAFSDKKNISIGIASIPTYFFLFTSFKWTSVGVYLKQNKDYLVYGPYILFFALFNMWTVENPVYKLMYKVYFKPHKNSTKVTQI